MTITNSALFRLLLSSASVAMCLSAAGAYAEEKTPITIVNNLEQPLLFKEVKNREDIKIETDPPSEIAANSSGMFKIAQGTNSKNVHLNIKYSIEGTDDEVGIVCKHNVGEKQRCPKEHPDWVTETVEHCGNYGSNRWSYTFDEKQE
jgi:hypothetical protein